MASRHPPIPRFLLPRPRARPPPSALSHRGVSSKSKPPKKPMVLEKPARFNPPSHGSRLPSGRSSPRHHGGPVPEAEVKAQARRDYPGMPPPEGTFGHKFLNNPRMHAWITVSTLFGLASYSLVSRFEENSPYAGLLPSVGQVFRHPIDSIYMVGHVLRLHMDDGTREALESRRGGIEDITKRKKYRRAHDVEDRTFLGSIIPDKYLTRQDEDGGAEQDGEGKEKKEAGGDTEEQKPKEPKAGWGRFA